MSGSDWSSIRAAHEAWLHRFEPRPDGTHTARQPGQGWTMTFDGRGFTMQPGDEGAGWHWGLELVTGSGRQAQGVARDNRLSYDRGNGITQWFINDGRGLEQGWTLNKPVAGGALHLEVRGGLEPTVSAQSVSFGGQLTYGGLKAWDAKGATVPVWFEAATDGDGWRRIRRPL